jgi:hypothetical protein
MELGTDLPYFRITLAFAAEMAAQFNPSSGDSQ